MALRAAQALAGESEVIARRTRFAKVFQRPDGKLRVVARLSPQHYDHLGQMREIDDTPETSDGITYTIRDAPYTASWDTQTCTLIYASKRGGGVRVRLLSMDGVNFTQSIEAARHNGQRVIVKVHPQLELEFRVRAYQVEIYKRLLGPSAPKILRWEIIEGDMTNVRVDPLDIVAYDNVLGLTERAGELVQRRRAEVLTSKGPETQLPEGRIRYVVTEQVTGRTLFIDPQTRARSWVDEIAYPVVVDVTVTEDVAANADDGTCKAAEFSYTNYCYTGSYNRFAMWRWQTVDVPQGQTLDSATLRVNVTGNTGTGSATIKGEDADDAAAWAGASANGPTTITQTTASATWNTASITGTGIKTLDVTSIVQEIINRAGWVANNDIRLIFTSSFASGTVTFEDFDAAGTDEGQLEIVYTSGGATGQPTMKRWAGVPGMSQTNSIGRGW